MVNNKIFNAICDIRGRKPLIHCITNPISINQCANVILSVGAKPIMAEHPREVCEITDTAHSLMLNIGNITDVRMESMMLSIKRAKERNIPVLLDAVGVACSSLRRDFVSELLKVSVPSVIKGNYSEIAAFYNGEYSSAGVDADESLSVEYITKTAKTIASEYGTIVLASGQRDIVTDGNRVVYVDNGTSQLASVTGTGCILGALCSAFMSSLSPMDSGISACVYFGICGELAETHMGNGSFMVSLTDRISTLGREEISSYMKVEDFL